jgi:hypothetical protein
MAQDGARGCSRPPISSAQERSRDWIWIAPNKKKKGWRACLVFDQDGIPIDYILIQFKQSLEFEDVHQALQ